MLELFPIGLVIALAALLLVSAPWLSARRPILSLAMVAGAILGPHGAGLVTPSLLDTLAPILALSAGWLALMAAESWDLASLRRARVGHVLLAIGGTATLGDASPVMLAALPSAVLLGCAALAADADAARDALARAVHPDPQARQAPALASLALGAALLGLSVAWGLQASAISAGSPLTWHAGRHVVMTLLAGGALGVVYAQPLRLAQGRAQTLALLLALPLVGWGLAGLLGTSPLCVLFVAGAILANDLRRRDLVFTLLGEHQRPMTLAMIFVAGAMLPLPEADPRSAAIWTIAAIFIVVRALAWRFAGSRVGLARVIPLSVLAIPMMLEALSWPGGGAPAYAAPFILVAAGTFMIDELLWLAPRPLTVPVVAGTPAPRG